MLLFTSHRIVYASLILQAEVYTSVLFFCHYITSFQLSESYDAEESLKLRLFVAHQSPGIDELV